MSNVVVYEISCTVVLLSWLPGGGFYCRSPGCGFICRRCVINVRSCVTCRPLTPSLGGNLPCVVFVKDHMVHDVMEGVSRYVHKFEVLFHLSQHSCQNTRHLLSNVFLECCAAPLAHFLYLCVRITREGERIVAPTSERVGVYALDGDALFGGVVEHRRSRLQRTRDMFCRDLTLVVSPPVQREEHFSGPVVMFYVYASPLEGPHGAEIWVSVGLVKHADSFPPVFLVVQF